MELRPIDWEGNRYYYNKAHGYYIRFYKVDGKRKKEYMHRDVYRKEHGSIIDGWVIHHINGNKKDNRIENLEMITKSQHSKMHSEEYKEYKSFIFMGGKNPMARGVICLDTLAEYDTASEASRDTGVCRVNICQVCNGVRNIAGGYSWMFLKEYKELQC